MMPPRRNSTAMTEPAMIPVRVGVSSELGIGGVEEVEVGGPERFVRELPDVFGARVLSEFEAEIPGECEAVVSGDFEAVVSGEFEAPFPEVFEAGARIAVEKLVSMILPPASAKGDAEELEDNGAVPLALVGLLLGNLQEWEEKTAR